MALGKVQLQQLLHLCLEIKLKLRKITNQRQLSGYCTEHITQLQFYKHAIIQGQSREQGAMQNNIVSSDNVKLINMTKKQTLQLFEERKVRKNKVIKCRQIVTD